MDGKSERTRESGRTDRDARQFIAHAFSLARSVGVETIVVLASELRGADPIGQHRRDERIVWLVRGEQERPSLRGEDAVIEVPETPLSRMGQLTIGLYVATLGGHVSLGERVLCLSGKPDSRRLDLLFLTRPREEFPWLQEAGLERTRDLLAPREFGRILQLLLHFASEGREGKPIGTTFVVGDKADLEPHLRQLILNPCAGHPARLRNIHNPEFAETLRELSALDGAIVVSRKGVVESAGTYLDAPVRRAKLRPGWGARHAAAASVTTVTDAVSFVVSESSGTLTVFDDGRPVLELERSR